MERTDYDIAIVGGGLGGLSLAIMMARQKYSVILLEKETYPFHKVCGEYISNESRAFMEHLGVNLQETGAQNIHRLTISTQKGKTLQSDLGLGGIGISRYTLDSKLAEIAVKDGVVLKVGCKVEDVEFKNDSFTLKYKDEAITAKVVAGAYGKRSNLDIKLKRPFAMSKPSAEGNYIGVKYHVKYEGFPEGMIELHNFKDGYCGMSAVEGDKYCMCYLTTSANLKKYGSIDAMEEGLLQQNPLLAKRMFHAEYLYREPLAISQVTFKAKGAVEDHILMLGDAAGAIAPLCGNGMSMSMHAAYLLSQEIHLFLKGSTTRHHMERNYTNHWRKHFSNRIKAGYYLQKLFGKSSATELSIGTLKLMPGLTKELIKYTHGEPFYKK